MTNDTLFDKIEAWLSGELSEADARAFEAEMAADSTLLAEVERHRRGRQALDRLAEQSLQEDMARWRTSLDELPPPPDTPPAGPSETGAGFRVWGGIVALVVLFGGVAWLLLRKPVEKPIEQAPPIEKPGAGQQTPVTPPPPIDSQKQKQQTNTSPQTPAPADSKKRIQIAAARLEIMQEAILLQHGQTMGDEDDKNPFFEAGLTIFKTATKKEQRLEAIRQLLQVPDNTTQFLPAQEMLAWLFFQEKNYAEATRRYETFAKQNAGPELDWRLAQFYLADYENRKVDFWKNLDEILDPVNRHAHRQDAQQLELELKKQGIRRK